jgi:hypothetical protein
MRNPQGPQASAATEGVADCGMGFACPGAQLSSDSHDADEDLSLSIKRVS